MHGLPPEITDSAGRRYSVRIRLNDGEHFLFAAVDDKGIQAAYANCNRRNDVLFLDDIHVTNMAPTPGRLVCWLPRWLRPTRAYRNRGLGSLMLKLTVSVAKARHLRRIEGALSPHDLKDSPTLPDWYKRNGFVVVNDATGVPNSVIYSLESQRL